MAKYIGDEEDVKGLDDRDRASLQSYFLNYDVDANIETAKGKDALTLIRDVIQGKPFSFGNPAALYIMLYAIFIGLAVLLFIILLMGFLINLIVWLIKKDDVTKLKLKMYGALLIVAVGLTFLVGIITKLRDNVQNVLEKIVYKL